MTLDLATARTRLTEGYYNAQSKTVANPGGMGADGHKENLPDALQAVGLVGTAAAASESTATADAATATAAAGTATTQAGIATTQAGIATTKAAEAAASAAAAAGAVNGVKVSSDDSTPGHLETKLLFGPGLIGTTQNGGGAETRTAAVDPDLVLASPTVSTLLTVAAGMQSGVLYLGDVSGDVIIEAEDAQHIYCTFTGDTTFLVAGGTVPGTSHDHLIHYTMGGAGGYAVATLPANLWTQSNAIDHADWTKFRTTTTTAAGTAPDGRETAVKLVDDGTVANTHTLVRTITKSASSLTYTIEGTFEYSGRHFSLEIGDNGTNGISGAVNLSSGTFQSAFYAFGSGWTHVSSSLSAESTGGYRLRVTFTTDAGTDLRFLLRMLDGSFQQSYDGDSTSGVIISWLNLVEGSVALGRQLVGATRAGQVVVQGTATDFPAMAAAATGDLGISIEPDGRIVTQDHTVEEL